MSDPGPRRPAGPSARAFRPRLDETVDAEHENDAPVAGGADGVPIRPAAPRLPIARSRRAASPQQLLPLGDEAWPPGPEPERYPRLRVGDLIPDVRDGLTRPERIVLWMLHEAQKEFPGRNVPTALLYGRVVEHINLTVPQFQAILARMVKPQ